MSIDDYRLAVDDNNEAIHFPVKLPSLHTPIIPPSQTDIYKILKRYIHQIEQPYKQASYITLALFGVNAIICIESVLYLFFSRVLKHPITSSYNRHYVMFLVSMFFQTAAVFVYICITLSHMNGGEYLFGLWLIIYSSVVGIVISLTLAVVNEIHKKSYASRRNSLHVATELELLPLSQQHSHQEFGILQSLSHNVNSNSPSYGSGDGIYHYQRLSHHPNGSQQSTVSN